MDKKLFKFKGCVVLFDQIISRNWEGETFAQSKEKALNNLTYRCKNQMGFIPATRITLQGNLSEV